MMLYIRVSVTQCLSRVLSGPEQLSANTLDEQRAKKAIILPTVIRFHTVLDNEWQACTQTQA